MITVALGRSLRCSKIDVAQAYSPDDEIRQRVFHAMSGGGGEHDLAAVVWRTLEHVMSNARLLQRKLGSDVDC